MTGDAGSDPTAEDRERILAQLAEQLISIRTSLGYDIDDAARSAGIDPQRLAEAEDAGVALSDEELERLADAYDVGVTAFFGGKVTPVQYLFGA